MHGLATEAILAATVQIRSSPALWPKVSLTSLRLSTSPSSTPRRAGLVLRGHHVVEPAAIGQLRQGIGLGQSLPFADALVALDGNGAEMDAGVDDLLLEPGGPRGVRK